MARDFTINIPDEPFKSTFDDGKTHTVTYTGPRYVVISVDPNDSNKVKGIEGESNDTADINIDEDVDDNWDHYMVDAYKDDNTLLHISRLSNAYLCQTEIDNYVEAIPGGDGSLEYDYDYPEESILGAIYKYPQNMTYNPGTKEFGGLQLIEPACTRDEIVGNHPDRIAEIDAELADTAGQPQSWIDELNAVKTWYQNFDSVYGSTDHWKIPYPSIPPRPFN